MFVCDSPHRSPHEQHSSQHHGWPVRSSPVHGSEKALGASSTAFQLRDTQDRASPESLASSCASCSGADRDGSGGAQVPDRLAQPPCYWPTASATASPPCAQGPCCWERTHRAGRAGGATGQLSLRGAPEDAVPEPLPAIAACLGQPRDGDA